MSSAATSGFSAHFELVPGAEYKQFRSGTLDRSSSGSILRQLSLWTSPERTDRFPPCRVDRRWRSRRPKADQPQATLHGRSRCLSKHSEADIRRVAPLTALDEARINFAYGYGGEWMSVRGRAEVVRDEAKQRTSEMPGPKPGSHRFLKTRKSYSQKPRPKVPSTWRHSEARRSSRPCRS